MKMFLIVRAMSKFVYCSSKCLLIGLVLIDELVFCDLHYFFYLSNNYKTNIIL